MYFVPSHSYSWNLSCTETQILHLKIWNKILCLYFYSYQTDNHLFSEILDICVTVQYLKSDCINCSISNMEYKHRTYRWTPQLTGCSARDLSLSTAMQVHILLPVTVVSMWSVGHFILQWRLRLRTTQYKRSHAMKTKMYMEKFKIFVTISSAWI